jgi:signal transduction histidine kinase
MSTTKGMPNGHSLWSRQGLGGSRLAAGRERQGWTRRLDGIVTGARRCWPLLLIVVATGALGFARIPLSSVQSVAVAIDVTTVLALAFAATLVRPRSAQTNRVDDGVVCAGLATLSAVYCASLILQVAFPQHAGSRLVALAPLGELACGGAMLAAARLSPQQWLAPGSGPRGLLLLGLTVAAAVAIAGLLPFGMHHAWDGGNPVQLGTSGASLLGDIVLVSAGLLISAAAFRIRPQGGRSSGGVTAWLALGLSLLAASVFARLVPSGFATQSVPLCDLLRLCAVAVIGVAVLRRESQLQAQAARRAALAERRRVARDLHDGIAQDLAFIAAHGSRAGELGQTMAIAARRALVMTRGVIDDLSALEGTPAREALDALAQELEDRLGVTVGVEVDRTAEVPAEISNDLLRIVREAVVNAARHGDATNVVVSVERADTGLVLRVRDDGCGIPGIDGGEAPGGFGLTSMRERAVTIGGQLWVSEAATGGTEVVVAWT